MLIVVDERLIPTWLGRPKLPNINMCTVDDALSSTWPISGHFKTQQSEGGSYPKTPCYDTGDTVVLTYNMSGNQRDPGLSGESAAFRTISCTLLVHRSECNEPRDSGSYRISCSAIASPFLGGLPRFYTVGVCLPTASINHCSSFIVS